MFKKDNPCIKCEKKNLEELIYKPNIKWTNKMGDQSETKECDIK